MKNVVILFKSGKEVTVQCREFEIVRDWADDPVGLETTGVTGNNILYMDFTQVACVYERHGAQ